jgi:hypothetical protein
MVIALVSTSFLASIERERRRQYLISYPRVAVGNFTEQSSEVAFSIVVLFRFQF